MLNTINFVLFLQVLLLTLQGDCRGAAFNLTCVRWELAWHTLTQAPKVQVSPLAALSSLLYCWSEQSGGCFGRINRGWDMLAGVPYMWTQAACQPEYLPHFRMCLAAWSTSSFCFSSKTNTDDLSSFRLFCPSSFSSCHVFLILNLQDHHVATFRPF